METTRIAQKADEGSGAADVRMHLRRMWGSVASGWEEHATWVDARGSRVAEKMLELADPQPGDRVLELACGAGGVGLAAAERVAPDGEVVVSDVAPEMTSIASARADALGLTNVSSRELDLERIDEPAASYDVVLCREGLMLVPDPERAVSEIRRVLRPGGRVALAVWGPRERNPWLGIVFDSVSAQLGVPMPPPGIPGPFSLEDADRLTSLLSTAGLVNVEVRELPTPYHASTVEEWWGRTAALAGPLAQRLAALPEHAREALLTRARVAISSYATPEGLEIPGVSLVAAATRS
jgi:ubiquinone/menaquinone biosynthesis C-methylase UbiE